MATRVRLGALVATAAAFGVCCAQVVGIGDLAFVDGGAQGADVAAPPDGTTLDVSGDRTEAAPPQDAAQDAAVDTGPGGPDAPDAHDAPPTDAPSEADASDGAPRCSILGQSCPPGVVDGAANCCGTLVCTAGSVCASMCVAQGVSGCAVFTDCCFGLVCQASGQCETSCIPSGGQCAGPGDTTCCSGSSCTLVACTYMCQ